MSLPHVHSPSFWGQLTRARHLRTYFHDRAAQAQVTINSFSNAVRSVPKPVSRANEWAIRDIRVHIAEYIRIRREPRAD